MEHLEKPKDVLLEIQSVLKEGGFVFLAVPDCESKMSVGDVSIIAHQHINYFTKQSLATLIRSSGYINVKVVRVDEVAMLCAWGKKSNKKIRAQRIKFEENEKYLLKTFQKSLVANLTSIQKLVVEAEALNKTIGLYGYCPNLRGLIRFRWEPRIFDGDRAKIGKRMIGTNTYFESTKDLIKNPVDVLFVTPIDYDQEIRKNLIKLGLGVKIASVISLKEIYEKNSGFKYTGRGSAPGR